jgi:hypothetical protein
VPQPNLEASKTSNTWNLAIGAVRLSGQENVVSAVIDELLLVSAGGSRDSNSLIVAFCNILINIFNLSPFKALINMLNS